MGIAAGVASWSIDLILALALLWLAWRALATTDLFKGIVLFIAFGLLMSLAWARLRVPDVALAEAAIGAGLTGALLLSALGRMRDAGQTAQTGECRDGASPIRQPVSFTRLLLLGALLTLGLGLGWVVWSLPTPAAGLEEQVTALLPQSGVKSPVTAVLLNFRGYDTLLEVAVLLLATLGVWSLRVADSESRLPPPSPILTATVRLLVPPMILVAGYLLWVGGHAPGGAFQAGAVLGAAGVLLLLAEQPLSQRLAGWPLRLLLAAGLGLFLAVALGAMVAGGQLLEYPKAWAGALIIAIETFAMLSIGAILLALFAGGRPPPPSSTGAD